MKAQRSVPLVLLLVLALALTVVTATALAQLPVLANASSRPSTGPAQEQPPDGDPAGSSVPHAVTACTTPTTATIRGKSVEFDQCYEQTFSHNSTDYTIHVFYTEQDSTTNLNQCDASDAAGRCEHKLSDNDDTNGDNVNAVAMAQEAETAIRFYDDRNLNHLSGTTLNVYIAEDPRSGGVIYPNSIYVDDERLDNNDQLQKRVLAFHENMHLVQDKYDSGVGWRSFYGEGISRAIEDRVDTQLDADTGHWFIPEVNGILGSNTNRTDDLATISYRSVLWWTWLFDQYRAGSDTEPTLGWGAIRDFYDELDTESDQLKAVRDYISSESGAFRDDFIDYTLALYAYKFNPSDSRLAFEDSEITSSGNNLSNHNIISGGPAFSTDTRAMNPRSSRYWEYNPANQCDFVAFEFDGNGQNYGFSIMTVDSGNLQKRWTSYSNEWARTVSSAPLDRVIGVVTSDGNSGNVDVGHGCVTPTLNIKDPTSSNEEMVGTADDPRSFIVRVDVDGKDGSAVAGLVASDFTVQLRLASGGPLLDATIINAVYVQDDYWLLVQPPDAAVGAQTGQFYDLIVTLGAQNDTENSAVLYVKRTQDVVVVLDRSGSMSFASGKIQAARNAAGLLINELADDDQGAFVAFDTDADLREPLDRMDSGSHRTDLEIAIANEVPLNTTSIGDGMITAATEEDANGIATNQCSFVLLSDGYENAPQSWADVAANVTDNGCAIHSIALGPSANEVLMQTIMASVPGGTYDYADSSGNVPILLQMPGSFALDSATAGNLGWQNNLSRIYDHKATQIAGRQRLGSASDPGSDNERFQEFSFFVDDTSTELVASVAWQSPTKGEQEIILLDPDGKQVTPSAQRKSPMGTNEVLRVLKPQPGKWTLRVSKIFQPYYVSLSAVTDFELLLFIGTPFESLSQGVQVPILATFIGPGKPVIGAKVVATVHDPDGNMRQMMLYDDGNHGDMEADDGVYGNWYSATSLADADAPQKVTEGEEPTLVGSYQVTVIGERGDIYREAQGSFAVQQGSDENDNFLPDDWEKRYGVDDPKGDPDKDGLLTICELDNGTNPMNPDTDGGGESDGSEVPRCNPASAVRDPLDPDDDRVGPLTGVFARPDLFRDIPIIILEWGSPMDGRLRYVNIYRRLLEGRQQATAWEIIAKEVSGNELVDDKVQPGGSYQYLVQPAVQVPDGSTVLIGGLMESNTAVPQKDPFPPDGSILINNGDEATADLNVFLEITADDLFGGGDGGPPEEPHPGSPASKLEMRISNEPDFAAAKWIPFESEIDGWRLADVRPGDAATVYVQFRDEAGNVSEPGIGTADSILYKPGGVSDLVYLPVITRP